MQLIEPKLKQLILLTICTCSSPIKPTDLLKILQLTNQVSERTFYSKLKELLDEGEIIKITCLDPTKSTLYFRS